jgi:hypothetical protein
VPDDLLRPTLGSDQAAQPVYSPRASFIVAFFGGPVAAVLFSALNSLRLRRLPHDLPVYAAALVVFVAAVGWLLGTASGAALLGWMGAGEAERRGLRLTQRVFALALWGVFHARHRAFHRNAELMGVEAPSPWLPGIACVLAGGAATAAIAALVLGALAP